MSGGFVGPLLRGEVYGLTSDRESRLSFGSCIYNGLWLRRLAWLRRFTRLRLIPFQNPLDPLLLLFGGLAAGGKVTVGLDAAGKVRLELTEEPVSVA